MKKERERVEGREMRRVGMEREDEEGEDGGKKRGRMRARDGGVSNFLFWYAIMALSSPSFTEKMEPKCTLHGSSASIMSVQFDQLVSVSVPVVRRGQVFVYSSALRSMTSSRDKYNFFSLL